MYHYIGIDVSKKVFNVFDGKKDLVFDNKETLSSLHGFWGQASQVHIFVNLYARYNQEIVFPISPT
ncbi:hypothetical protein ES705_47288 [subsurface metagenome]